MLLSRATRVIRTDRRATTPPNAGRAGLRRKPAVSAPSASPDGDIVSYSFREARDLIAWLREDGDYMDWYCSGGVGVVVPWIGDALAAEGWNWTTTERKIASSS